MSEPVSEFFPLQYQCYKIPPRTPLNVGTWGTGGLLACEIISSDPSVELEIQYIHTRLIGK